MYNDSRVRNADSADATSSSAYLLFYQRVVEAPAKAMPPNPAAAATEASSGGGAAAAQVYVSHSYHCPFPTSPHTCLPSVTQDTTSLAYLGRQRQQRLCLLQRYHCLLCSLLCKRRHVTTAQQHLTAQQQQHNSSSRHTLHPGGEDAYATGCATIHITADFQLHTARHC